MYTEVGKVTKTELRRKKVHLSSKLDNKEKDKTPEELVHPNWVWKKDIFMSRIELSLPSKVWAFLSLQIPHIKQWETMFQITPFHGGSINTEEQPIKSIKRDVKGRREGKLFELLEVALLPPIGGFTMCNW